jgi:hypothetical protein
MPIPRPIARRILLLALGAGVIVDVVVPGNAAGINAVIVMAGLLAVAALVAGRAGIERVDPADSWVPVAALAFAAMSAIRADDWLVTADLLLAAALGAGTVACLAGARITRGLVPAIVALTLGTLVAAMTGAIAVLGGLRPRPGRVPAGTPADEPAARRAPAWLIRSVPVLRGLLLAVPVLVLFAALFASADAVFAQLAREALDWRIDLDLSSVVERATVVTVVAWTVAGLLALGAGLLPELIPGHDRPAVPPPPPWAGGRSLGAASAAEMTRGHRLGTVEAATVLTLVAGLFAAFVVLQLAYLFGGRDTMSIAGLTYAEYARRGFFELVAVAVLAGMLVVALDLAVGERSKPQLTASLVLLGLTGIVLWSAFVRLRLYQDAYGWTELRLVVVVAIGWLAVAIGATAWLLIRRATRWTLHVLGVMVLITLAGMNVVGPQAFVADRNLERALDPALVPPGGRVGLDAAYIASLGDEAVPAVVAAYPGLGPGEQDDMATFLGERRRALATDPALAGWPAWNLTRERARAALAGWAAASGR